MEIPLAPILAPETDGVGQLRVDDPEVDTPQGVGGNVFKDRGSLDRADFIGPAAILINPQDNDALGLDRDPANSIVQLTGGVYSNFSIQIVDGFESADPFPGIGVDDKTLDGRSVQIMEGGLLLDLRGPAVTVFQDGVYLREGIDYSFRFNQTSNTIILVPLAGIWPDDKVYQISVNNRDRFVIDAQDGLSLVDGDSFTVTNGKGDTGTYEFESGYSLIVSSTLGLQVPLFGIGPGGISDGQRFSIDEGSRPPSGPVVFEFDLNGNWQSSNRRIPIPAGASADEIAAAIVTALATATDVVRNAQGQVLAIQPNRLVVPLQPRNLGGGLVHVGAENVHLVSLGTSALTSTITQIPVSLTVPPGGGGTLNPTGETFVVSNGPLSLTFELSSTGVSTVPGSIVIPFQAQDSPVVIATLVANFLANPRGFGNELMLSPISIGNGVIQLGANASHSFDMSNTSLTRQVSVGGVNDGEVITLRHSNGTVATIELDRDGVFSTAANNTVISVDASSTHLDLAAQITNAVQTAGVDLDPVNGGNGLINVGGVEGIHQVTVSQPSSLTLVGAPGVRPSTTLILPSLPGLEVDPAGVGAFTDGDSFTITVGNQTATFEFDNDGQFADVDNNGIADNKIIQLQPSDSQAILAQNIAMAITQESTRLNLGLNPTTPAPGLVALNGPATVNLFSAGLTSRNLLGPLNDGETFTIDNGSQVVTFEFESLATGNGVAGTNIPITFQPGSFVELAADSLRASLAAANIGLNPSLPTQGIGQVELGDSPRHLTDISGTSLGSLGVPGGAFAINIRANFSESQVASAVVVGINAASNRNTGVSAALRGGSTLFVDISEPNGKPVNFASGFATVDGIDNFFLSAVKDLAGNSLKANQSTDETIFTILLPGVVLDFGDAPDPFAGSGNYPTLFASNGARHVIGANLLHLGSGVDAEPDGQPTLAADGDDSDHSIQLLNSSLGLLGSPPFSIQVPAGGGAAITPGETFTIVRGGRASVTFTFVLNGNVTSPQIGYLATDTADTIANKIVAAIQAQSALALRPTNLGNGLVSMGGTPSLSIGVADSSFTLTGDPLRQLVLPLRLVVSNAAAIAEGARFVISDGVNPVTFEFDRDGMVSGGVVPVNLNGAVTAADVAGRVRTAVNGAIGNQLTASANADVVTFTGIGPGHTIDVVNAPTLSVDRAPAAGDSFIINDGFHPSVVFEISVDGAAVTAGRVAIRISSGDSPAVISEAIRVALQSQTANLNGLTPLVANDHTVTLAFHRSDTLDLSMSSLTHANRAPASLLVPGAGLAIEIPSIARLQMPASGASIADGDFFTIDDGINPEVRFEFDNNGSFNGILLTFNASFTRQNLADLVRVAIQAEVAAGRLVGITPSDLGNGLVDLQPLPRVRVDTTGTNGHVQKVAPVNDRDAFQIDDRVHAPVTFEFDLNGSLSLAGARPINVTLRDSADDIAKKVEAAIKNATLAPNVLGTPDNPVLPVSIGKGIVDVSMAANAQLIALGTPQFAITGVAGGIADGQQFTISDGTRTWTFEFDRNNKSVEGRQRIAYLANDDANAIGRNLAAAINAVVPTLAASNLGNGLVLLQVADEDGVRFDRILVPGRTTPITVTASGTGFLDAWFDFNHDGDWNDPGEQVLVNAVVHAGQNSLSVTVPQVLPSNSPLGNTYARFRLSSAGNLLPTGLAVDGEVEDYRVRILNNSAPLENSNVLGDLIVAEDSPDTLIDLSNAPAFSDVNLNDGNGDSLTFTVGTRLLTVVQNGAAIREGSTITIFAANGADSRTFEFTRDNLIASGKIAVPITDSATPAQIASSLAQQIELQGYGLTASVNGPSILLTGEGSVVLGPAFTAITLNTGFSVEILQAGTTLLDGGTVTIVAASNNQPRTFEFDNDGLTLAGNIAVPFDSTSTRADLAAALSAAINRTHDMAGANYGVAAVIDSTNSAVVRLNGQSLISYGSVFDGAVATSDSTLQVLRDGANFTEASQVTITSTQGGPRTFEFTKDFTFGTNNVPVFFDTTRTPAEIAALLAQAITNASFGVIATVDPLQPTLVRLSGNSTVALGAGFNDLSIGTGSGLLLREDGSTLTDSATITIATANGLDSRTFEFDSNGSVASGNRAVVFDATSTTDEIMARLAAQIAASNYGVVGTSDPLDGAILRLSGSGTVTFAVGFDDLRLVSDKPILIPSIDIDGQTLRLDYQPDENGIVNVTVRATDQGGLFAESTFQVFVAPGNDVPIAAGIVDATLVTPSAACQVTFSDLQLGDGFNETIELCEDHAVTVTLRGNDGDPLPLERQALTFEILDASNSNGTITGLTSNTGDLETGRFVFTPNANFNGSGVIVFRVRDDGSAGAPFQQPSAPFTLTVNVSSVNDPPTGMNQVGAAAVGTPEDTAVTITLAGDDDGNAMTSEAQNLTFTIVTFPAHGRFTSGVDVDGSITGVIGRVTSPTLQITYQPDPNFNNNANSPLGPDSFTFNVTDNGAPPATSVTPATVQINVTPVNDAPIPEVVLATTTSTICQPMPGTLMLGTDLRQTVLTCEDLATTLTLGGSTGDAESTQTLTFTLVSGPSQGSLGTITATSSTQAMLVYTPPTGFNGTTSFVVRATDNGQTNGAPASLSDELTVTITVQPVNAAPIPNSQVGANAVTTLEDNAKSITLTADDGDPGVVQTLRYFVLPGPDNNITRTANGTLSGLNATTGEVIGQLVFTPDLNFNGMDSFTFQVQDDASAGNPPNRFSDPNSPGTVAISVTPVNDPPTAIGQSVVTNEDTALTIMLTGNDVDAGETQLLTYHIATTPGRGSLTALGGGSFSYLPSANFNGTDTFTFRSQDPGGAFSLVAATVTVTVNPLNDAPQFTIGQPLTVLEDSGPQTVIAWTSG
ncbi:MAG: tandem-95 repeat protein, partial [Planctomycetota bacterium]